MSLKFTQLFSNIKFEKNKLKEILLMKLQGFLRNASMVDKIRSRLR